MTTPPQEPGCAVPGGAPEAGESPARGLRVRPARPEDCGRIAEAYNDAIASGRATMDTERFDGAWFAAWLDSMGERECLLCAESGSGVIGWGAVKRYSDRPGYAPAAETSVYLLARATGHGVGSRIQRALLEHARRAGYRHLVAKILAVNAESVRFHRRFGYRIVGTQHRIGHLNGTWHDVVILERLLDDEPHR